MSRRRAYSEETLGIMRRFFEAVDAIKEYKRISNVQQYLDLIGVPKSHYYMQRKEIHRGFFEVGWIVPLVRNFGISSAWLLTGVGAMFNA